MHAMHFPPLNIILVLSFQKQRESIQHNGLYSLSNKEKYSKFEKKTVVFTFSKL